MFIDYHVHPDFSIDAIGTIDQYCQRATEIGLQEICFTTHFETDPVREKIDGYARVKGKRVPIISDWWETYFEEIGIAKEKYADLLTIRAGTEVDYVINQKSTIENVIQKYPFDYILLGIHSLEHIGFSSRSEYEQLFSIKSAEQIFNHYWETLSEAIEWNIFNGIAHLDLYERYGKGYYGNSLHRECELMFKVLKKIANKNLVVEINTSGLRGQLASTMPGEELLKLCLSAGIKNYTIGSDSHRVEQLGMGIKDGINVLKRYGIDSLCTFENRQIYRNKL